MWFKDIWQAIENRAYKSDYQMLSERYYRLAMEIDLIKQHLGIEILKRDGFEIIKKEK